MQLMALSNSINVYVRIAWFGAQQKVKYFTRKLLLEPAAMAAAAICKVSTTNYKRTRDYPAFPTSVCMLSSSIGSFVQLSKHRLGMLMTNERTNEITGRRKNLLLMRAPWWITSGEKTVCTTTTTAIVNCQRNRMHHPPFFPKIAYQR